MGLRVRCVTKIGCELGKTEVEGAVEEGLGDGYGSNGVTMEGILEI